MRIEVLIGVGLALLAIGMPIAMFGPGYLRSRNEARLRTEGLPAATGADGTFVVAEGPTTSSANT